MDIVDKNYITCSAQYKFVLQINNFTYENFKKYRRSNVFTKIYFDIVLGDIVTKWICKVILNSFELEFHLFLAPSDNLNFIVDFHAYILTKSGLNNELFVFTYESRGHMFDDTFGMEKASINLFNIFTSYDFYVQDEALTMLFKMGLKGAKCKEEKFVSLPNDISLRFEELFNSGDFSDFTIICSDDVKFPVHRCILCAQSAVFKAMLQTKMIESINNTVRIEDIDGDAMKQILHFMYTSKVKNFSNYLLGLMYGAEKYQLDGLKEICINYMDKSFQVDTVIEFFKIALLFDVQELIGLCIAYIKVFINYLKASDKWKDLKTHELEFIDQAIAECETRYNFTITYL